MIILNTTTRTLEAVLSAVVAANQPSFTCHYVDTDNGKTKYNPGSSQGLLNSITDVTIVPAASSGLQRQVKYLSFYNRDTANVTLQVHYDSGGTEYEIIKVVLAPGSTLEYIDTAGWRVIASNGGFVTGPPVVKETIEFIIAGYSSITAPGLVISTGVQGYVRVPFDCRITGVTLLADIAGDIVVDIWKDTYANYPPTVADTITAAAKPTLSGVIKSQDTTLTGWTTTVSEGDILGFNVDSVATLNKVTVALHVNRT